jgi:hypothetical protein
MADFNEEDKLKSRLEEACRPVSAASRFKERLLNRLILEKRATVPQEKQRLWLNPLVWAAAAAVFAVFLVVYGVLAQSRPAITNGPAQPPVAALLPSTPSPPFISANEQTNQPAISPGAQPELPLPSVSPAPKSAPVFVSTGLLEIRVTDAPPKPEVTGINVTVDSVEIHKPGTDEENDTSWLPTQLSNFSSFDLLKIKGLEKVLANLTLAPGNYTQIRMSITRVEVSFNNTAPVDAKLPSGKLRFTQLFEVAAEKTTILLFDFDAESSVVVMGNGDVIFKPVIKLIATRTP